MATLRKGLSCAPALVKGVRRGGVHQTGQAIGIDRRRGRLNTDARKHALPHLVEGLGVAVR